MMSQSRAIQSNQHTPVLLDEVLVYLAPKAGDSYLDVTAGYGGHASSILDITANDRDSVLVDRDKQAIAALQKHFVGRPLQIFQRDFLSAAQSMQQEGRQFDLILADLGVSSPHLDNASRGFSLRQSGPLDMRMDQEQELTAEAILNGYKESDLMKLLRQYGEEPKAAQIAHRIVSSRPIKDTTELAQIVAQAWPGYSKVHPATRTFQALRLAVNNELELLTRALPVWFDLLAPGGRVVVISFHSLEDRIVKQALSEAAGERFDASLRLLTKRPITAKPQEIVFNPRARSAKLRAAVKIKTF